MLVAGEFIPLKDDPGNRSRAANCASGAAGPYPTAISGIRVWNSGTCLCMYSTAFHRAGRTMP